MNVRRRVVLASFVAAAFIPVVAAAPGDASPARRATVPAMLIDEAAMEAQIFQLINASRAEAGLAPMVRSAVLDGYADQWSQHLAARACSNGAILCHRSRDSLKAMATAAAPHGVRWWAENVQYTGQNAAYAHSRLMASSGHRANILRPTTNLVGIGVVFTDTGVMYVTEEFVEGKPPPPPPHPCGKVTRTLRYRSKGSQVQVLQCALADLGLYAGSVDGVYGVTTREAVKQFQRQRGIRATGVVYSSTRKALGVTR